MPVGRISKRSIAALVCKQGQARSFLWDDAIAGFGAMALPSGTISYIVQYRCGGRSRRFSIGTHGRLTPDEARKEAQKLLGLVAAGSDPAETRKATRETATFADVADRFMRLSAPKKCKPRTIIEYQRWIDKRLLPAFGARPMASIRKGDITKLHDSLSHAPIEANRVVSLFRTIWNWAERRGEPVGDKNPVIGLEKYKETARERYLTNDELARLGAALQAAETKGLPYDIDETKAKAKHAAKPASRLTQIDPFAVAAIRLLLLTGARKREILDAKWSEFDPQRGALDLADSKTGKKTIYLSSAALTVIASLPRIKDNPYIIPGALPGKPRADLNKPWAAVTKAAGLTGMRLHDLRHSFASFGAGERLGLPIIGKLLGHTQASTTQRYAHLDADPLKRAVDTIGATIEARINNSQGAKLINMPKAREKKT